MWYGACYSISERLDWSSRVYLRCVWEKLERVAIRPLISNGVCKLNDNFGSEMRQELLGLSGTLLRRLPICYVNLKKDTIPNYAM